MKRLILSAAVLAIVTSCSTNEVTDVAPSMQNAIGFSTLNHLTKGANDAGEMYKVYAAQAGVTAAWYIDDVSISDTELTYTYYWPVDKSNLTFYAYAPDTAATASVTPATAISIEYTVPSTADEDFTIAAPITANANTVEFQFAHQLSRATVEVVLDGDLENAGYVLTMEDDAEVTLSVANETATFDVMGNTATSYTAGSTGSVSYTKDYTGNYFIFMPQSATNCTISVSGVTITDKSSKKIIENATLGTYTIKSSDLTAGFLQNYNYAITLTIDEESVTTEGDIFGDAIAFSATQTGWTTYTDGLGLGSDNQ